MEPTRELVQPLLDDEPIPSKGVLPSRFCIVRFLDNHLAVELSQVREICKLDLITSVPGIPRALVGVANLRGNIVPIVDLYPSLGLPGEAALHAVITMERETQAVEAGSATALRTGDVFRTIPSIAERSAGLAQSIASSAAERVSSTDQVGRAIKDFTGGAMASQEATTHTHETVEEPAKLAEGLTALVAQLKLA